MPTKAQQDFVSRKDVIDAPTDGRDFLTWYHPEDLNRLMQYRYSQAKPKERAVIHQPVMVFNSDDITFSDKMYVLDQALRKSKKQALPFIIAPELGGAHFIAGIIRKSSTGVNELFIFNPTGYTKQSAMARLSLDDLEDVGCMQMHVSELAVQTQEKDKLLGAEKDNPLVSCGPISMMFIDYILSHPEYIDSLDESVVLPEPLQQLASKDIAEYQSEVKQLRQSHYAELANIADDELEAIDLPFYKMTQKIIDTLAVLNGADVASVSESETSTEDMELQAQEAISSISNSSESYEAQKKGCQEKEELKLPLGAIDKGSIKKDPEQMNLELNQSSMLQQQLSKNTKPKQLTLKKNDYQKRSEHYFALSDSSDDPLLREVYKQVARINQRALTPGMLDTLGSWFFYNPHKVSFKKKANTLNKALDKLGELSADSFKTAFTDHNSEIYQAFNKTTMTYVDKTISVQCIEKVIDEAAQHTPSVTL